MVIMDDKKKKLVPVLRFSEFVGEWEKKTLGKFLEFKNGINASKEQYGKGYKFINVLDIINNDFITHEKIIGLVDVDENVFKKSEVTYGDILFQRSSETREEVGQSNVYLDKERTATFGGFVIRGKKQIEYNPIYMNYLLKTSKVRKEITSRSGGSTRYNVGQDVLKNIPFFYTSNDKEQQKIANFLSSADKKIEQLRQKVSLLEDYKKGVMQQIFSQQIRFKDDNGEAFADWEVKRFGEIFSFIRTNSFSRNLLNYDSGEVKNIHYGDIHTKFKGLLDLSKEKVPYLNQEVDISKVAEEDYCQEGDLVIADASEDYADIGKSIEVVNLNNERLVAGLHTYIARSNTKMALGFKSYLMQCWDIRHKVMVIATGVSVLGISKTNLSKITIEFPCVKEQQKIANFLSSIDDKIQQSQQQLAQAQQFKKGLLQQLFV